MASLFNRVAPGALIEASLINQMQLQIEMLWDQINMMQGGATPSTAVSISTISPSGPIPINTEVQILGKNFGFSVGANRVHVDTVRVLGFKPGSSDTLLIFDLPDPGGVVNAGTQVDMVVSNASTSDRRTITVLPAVQTLQGNVDVEFVSVSPPTVVAPGSATLKYRLRSRANIAADWLVTPSVSVAAWQPTLQVLDELQAPVAGNIIRLAAGQVKEFHVHIPSQTAGPTSFTMTVTASSGSVTGSSGPTTIPIGSPAPVPDPTITLSPTFSVPPTALAGSTLSRAVNQSAIVHVDSVLTVPGTYNVSVALTAGANWTTSLVAGTSASFPVSQGQLDSGGGAFAQPLEFSVRANVGANATGMVTLTVQRAGATQDRQVTLTLQLI